MSKPQKSINSSNAHAILCCSIRSFAGAALILNIVAQEYKHGYVDIFPAVGQTEVSLGL